MNADLDQVGGPQMSHLNIPEKNDNAAGQLDILENELVNQTSRTKLDVMEQKGAPEGYSLNRLRKVHPPSNQENAPRPTGSQPKDFLIRRSDIYSDGYYNSGVNTK